jgi:hypothetical protein
MLELVDPPTALLVCDGREHPTRTVAAAASARVKRMTIIMACRGLTTCVSSGDQPPPTCELQLT